MMALRGVLTEVFCITGEQSLVAYELLTLYSMQVVQ